MLLILLWLSRSIFITLPITLVWLGSVLYIILYSLYYPIWLRKKPKPLPRARKFDFKFLERKEVMRYVSGIIILLDLKKKLNSSLIVQGQRIVELWSKSGTIFTIKYLSEVLRLVFVFLSGEDTRDLAIWVKLRKSGIPSFIVPKYCILLHESRKILREGGDSPLALRGLISLLSIFRSMSGHHYIKFKTVTDPFNGVCSSYDADTLSEALGSLGLFKLRLHKPTFFLSSKSGVNSSSAFLSIAFDSIAYTRRPSLCWTYISLCYRLGYYQLLFAFVINLLIAIPFSFLTFWEPFFLGRLSIVKECRGKARVIGITDNWTQWLLRPLHDGIYRFLDTLVEDGTRDQLAPLYKMLESLKDPDYTRESLVSVDLSAATDRLPVDLQRDILLCLGYPGDLWKALLSRPYKYLDQTYTYSVGQPMGAYSSFAMLALSNHVLCHMAALKAGLPVVKSTGRYAVLGDDVAHRCPKTAAIYTSLLRDLGVEVNPIKGFNGEIVEFAKRVFYRSGVELSPIGAKTLAHSIRLPTFLASLLSDMLRKRIITPLHRLEMSTVHKFFIKIYQKTDKFRWGKFVLSILGPQGGLWTQSKDNQSVKDLDCLFTFELEHSWGVAKVDFITLFANKVSSLAKATLPFVGVGEAVKSILGLHTVSLWPVKSNRSTLHSPGYMALLTTLTVLPLPLFLLIRDLFRRFQKDTSSFLLWLLLLWPNIGYFESRLFLITKVDTLKDLIRYLKFRYTLIMYGEMELKARERREVEVRDDHPSSFKSLEMRAISTLPIKRIYSSAVLFNKWMNSLILPGTVQILTEKQKSREVSIDELPAVRTADKILRKLSPDYASWSKLRFKKVLNSRNKSKLKRLRKRN